MIGYLITIPFQVVRLTEVEKNSNPYKGDEILIFKSNKSETDTIKLGKVSVEIHPPDMNSMFFSRNTQVLRIYSKVRGCGTCYLLSYETKIKSPEATVYFDVFLSGKRYSHSFSFSELSKLREHRITVNGRKYNDVKFLDRKYKKFDKQHIDRIYWSNSKGIIRIDVDKNYFWELVKRE